MIAAYTLVVATLTGNLGQIHPVVGTPTAENLTQIRVEADRAYESSDWNTSESRYSKLVTYPNAKPADYYRLGRSRIELKRYTEALKPLDVALASAYEVETTELLIARAYAGLELHETCLNHLEEAVRRGLEDIQLVRKAKEFESLKDNKRFIAFCEVVEFPAVKEANGRLLDFMLGFWNYMMPGGAQGGFSVIRKQDKGFEIQEQWTSIDGTKSTTTYRLDKQTGTWNALSTNNQGWKSERTVIKINGGIRIQGVTSFPDGTIQHVREDWRQRSGTEMEQVICHSYDGGATWEELVRGKFTIAIAQTPP